MSKPSMTGRFRLITGQDITSIWDATIVAREGDRYTIANAGWNAGS